MKSLRFILLLLVTLLSVGIPQATTHVAAQEVVSEPAGGPDPIPPPFPILHFVIWADDYTPATLRITTPSGVVLNRDHPSDGFNYFRENYCHQQDFWWPGGPPVSGAGPEFGVYTVEVVHETEDYCGPYSDTNGKYNIMVILNGSVVYEYSSCACGVSEDGIYHRFTIEYPLPGPIVDVSKWEHLISYRPPMDIQQALQNRDISVQHIEGTWTMNADLFSISFRNMPINPMTGIPFASPGDLLYFIRTNLDMFAGYNAFYAYDAVDDGKVWAKRNPVGAVMAINLQNIGDLGQEGDVVVSKYYEDATTAYWRFSTLTTPSHGIHPVSGNREFGVYCDSHLERCSFYTRGADGAKLGENIALDQGEKFWVTFFKNASDFLKDRGANITKVDLNTQGIRWDWVPTCTKYWHPVEYWIDDPVLRDGRDCEGRDLLTLQEESTHSSDKEYMQ